MNKCEITTSSLTEEFRAILKYDDESFKAIDGIKSQKQQIRDTKQNEYLNVISGQTINSSQEDNYEKIKC